MSDIENRSSDIEKVKQTINKMEGVQVMDWNITPASSTSTDVTFNIRVLHND